MDFSESHRIQVKNFGPVRQADFQIERFTLLIGEQASGKSTLAKLIYFFRSFQLFFWNCLIANGLADWTSFRREYLAQMKDLFTKTFGPTATLGDFHIQYQYGERCNITLTPSKDRRFLSIQFSVSLNHMLIKAQSAWKNIPLNQSREEILQNDPHLPVQELLFAAFHSELGCVYIPAGRAFLSRPALLDLVQSHESAMAVRTYPYSRSDPLSIMIMDAMTRHYLQETSVFRGMFFSQRSLSSRIEALRDPDMEQTEDSDWIFWRDAVEYLYSLYREILKGDYNTDGKDDFILLEDGTSVPIYFASSGQQEVLWVLNLLMGYILRREHGTLILVEEPETHLHPDAQYALVKMVAAYQNLTGSPVLFTTHSPYILSSVNNLLYASAISKTVGDEEKRKVLDDIVRRESRIDETHFQSFCMEAGTLSDIQDQELHMADVAALDGIASRQDEEYEDMRRLRRESRT